MGLQINTGWGRRRNVGRDGVNLHGRPEWEEPRALGRTTPPQTPEGETLTSRKTPPPSWAG